MTSASTKLKTSTATGKPTKKLYLYDIDPAQSSPSVNSANLQGSEINEFLINITQKTITDTNHKIFTFNKDSPVKKILSEFLATIKVEDEEARSLLLAKKLLAAEKLALPKAKKLKKSLKKGSMVVCHFESVNRNCLIISKLDFEPFLEEGTYSKKQGLPEKKGVLKSCVIDIDSDGILENDAYLLDSNGSIASYWALSFLDTHPKVNNATNTKNAYSKILQTFVGLARSSKVDYQHLKNNLIGYFSTNTTFTVTGLIESMIGSYEPEKSDKVDLEDIKTKIKALVENKEFDGTFDIDDDEIKKQYKQVLKLDGDVVVTTKKNYNDRIYKKEIDGKMFMLIRTDIGLEEVKEYKAKKTNSK
ncbi:nucleoid-associated protein [Vibrio jasicida]|uniref:nucleoid-associated protein n=1 Tax=Vibrio jasicida TaxID=766224 RepID=UPI0005F0A267|nr:nucleoid-associated protein [Vibrio jasicida]